MKRIIVLVLSLILAFSFIACSNGEGITTNTTNATKAEESTANTEAKEDKTYSPPPSGSSNIVSHYCDAPGCTREGTKTYSGIGGQTEHYCYTHYNEIIKMMSDMEKDVGKSAYSKHTCEECNREGTHSIIGISGNREYYCSTHYNELKELLDLFR